MAKGPPVVLFPSLAGSVLECRQSRVPEFEGKRIWMAPLNMMISSSGQFRLSVKDQEALTGQEITQPFVQHIVLQPHSDGKDMPGFVVRAKEGLAGLAARWDWGLTMGRCEYLSESALMKDGTVIMGVISDMLRRHGYSEWDGTQGSMIGCSYDWRLAPAALEERDRFFSRMAEQLEAMVQANGQPAVVLGFSLGCRIAKYFLHFLHATRGREWLDRHCAHFVALGGPWLGAVSLMRSVLVDGAFPPLDMLFTESQMLTIMRSVPVGKYLQPIGDWRDGLDMPFVYLREEIFLRIEIGELKADRWEGGDEPDPDEETPMRESHSAFYTQLDGARLDIEVNGVSTTGEQTISSYNQRPFATKVSFALGPLVDRAHVRVAVRGTSGCGCTEAVIAQGEYELSWQMSPAYVDSVCIEQTELDASADSQGLLLTEELCINMGCNHCCRSYGTLRLRAHAITSEALSDWGSPWMPRSAYPLAEHNGGMTAEWSNCMTDQERPTRWKPARAAAVQGYEGVYLPSADTWKVPGPDGTLADDTVAPPVDKLTCMYGVKVHTARSIFLRHRESHWSGGFTNELKSAFVIDKQGDVDGLFSVDGVGYETADVAQIRPDSEEQVFTSGDGTVNYQSLRHAATWSGECEVEIYELPGCDHRGVSMRPEMLRMLKSVLGLGSEDQNRNRKEVLKEKFRQFEEVAQRRFQGLRGTCVNNLVCAVFAKSGFRTMNVHRRDIRHLVVFLVLGCLALLVLIIISGTSMNYDIVKTFSCGSARLVITNEAFVASQEGGQALIESVAAGGNRLWIGVLNYAYNSNLDGHVGAHCVLSYNDCRQYSVASWHLVPPVSATCDLGLIPSTCEACYHAGWRCMTNVILSGISQLFLAALCILRTHAFQDDRLRKFAVLPWTVLTVFGALWSYSLWETECYNRLGPDSKTYINKEGMESALEVEVKRQAFIWAGILVAFSAVLVLILQMLIPVPELFQRRCLDPLSIENQPNSLTGAKVSDLPESGPSSSSNVELRPWFASRIDSEDEGQTQSAGVHMEPVLDPCESKPWKREARAPTITELEEWEARLAEQERIHKEASASGSAV